MTTEGSLVYTANEAAAALKVHTNTIYNAIARGELPVVKLGRRRLIPKVAISRLLGEAPSQGEGGEV